jgi:hypothetical protein
MQTTNDNLNSRTTDREWRFLGEYPLNELMIEMDNRDRTSALFQTIRDMGINPEYLSNIESKLIGFAKEAMAHLNQGGPESPVYIRLFYQKKTIEDVNSAKSSSQFNAELTIGPKQIIHQSDTGINGGWGYFLIERGGGFPSGSSVSTCNWIDLYLYQEGE